MSNDTTEAGRALRDPGGVTHIASWTDSDGVTYVAYQTDRIAMPEYTTTVFCGSSYKGREAPWSSVDCMTCIVTRDRLPSE